MKKTFSALFVCLLLAYFTVAAFADYPHQRWGIRQDAFFPLANEMELKTAIYSYLLELDGMRNSRLDTGIRLGYSGFAANTNTYNANYDMVLAGLGMRYFFDEREEMVKTLHVFKRYAALDGNFYLASRYQSITPTSPSSLAGLGVKVGVGTEYIFGPHSNGFVEGSYLLTSIRSADGAYTLPLNGLVLAFGIRMER